MHTTIASKKALLLKIQGLVQGVGFRPFVFRLAKRYRLKGWVLNRTDGVIIHIEGADVGIKGFLEGLKTEVPPAAQIKSVDTKQTNFEAHRDFLIKSSEGDKKTSTEISPDIGVCKDCLFDMQMQPHRLHYPLINCTNCGPRYTIIQALPYDRDNTTMRQFELCDQCKEEYENPMDRRFHAQPVACNSCGPDYFMQLANKEIRQLTLILKEVQQLLNQGKAIALKGTGGYHLICDATNSKAVGKIRNIKKRGNKPFAVMFADLKAASKYCEIQEDERKMLTSWRYPIVLLDEKRRLCNAINPGLDTIGTILPYMPFHYLLFQAIKQKALVFTSANSSGSPIISGEEEMIRLKNEADAIIYYNRKIENKLDDSVCQYVGKSFQLIRRSRGYVPSPIDLPFSVDGIFAAGADMKAAFAMGVQNQAIMSPYAGDMQNHEVYNYYVENQGKFEHLFRFSPKMVVADLHPLYHSVQYARKLSKFCEVPFTQVQHHHAHAVSCMAENGLEGDVLAVCMDGTGYGPDGTIWGSEFMVCNYTKYNRFAHFREVALPGGDKAVEEPLRIAWSYIYKLLGKDAFGFFTEYGLIKEIVPLINWAKQIENGINSPLSAGAGRLFDAVASILGVSFKNSYDGEAAMKLERLVAQNENCEYVFEGDRLIDTYGVIKQIISDVRSGVEKKKIAAAFHNGLVSLIIRKVGEMKKQTGIKKLVLSGGVFQNRYLLGNLLHRLYFLDFEVYTNSLVPSNDGGLALGQMAIAAHKK